jgi:hypothetical protein
MPKKHEFTDNIFIGDLIMSKSSKPNFRVKHPYGYLIRSILLGLVLLLTSVFSVTAVDMFKRFGGNEGSSDVGAAVASTSEAGEPFEWLSTTSGITWKTNVMYSYTFTDGTNSAFRDQALSCYTALRIENEKVYLFRKLRPPRGLAATHRSPPLRG